MSENENHFSMMPKSFMETDLTPREIGFVALLSYLSEPSTRLESARVLCGQNGDYFVDVLGADDDNSIYRWRKIIKAMLEKLSKNKIISVTSNGLTFDLYIPTTSKYGFAKLYYSSVANILKAYNGDVALKYLAVYAVIKSRIFSNKQSKNVLVVSQEILSGEIGITVPTLRRYMKQLQAINAISMSKIKSQNGKSMRIVVADKHDEGDLNRYVSRQLTGGETVKFDY